MKYPTYILSNIENNSDAFYQHLEIYTDIILARGTSRLGKFVDGYYAYLEPQKIEKLRTKDEYLLELIMIGILWRNYCSKATGTSGISLFILKTLYNFRKKYPAIKPQIDKLRGILTYKIINKSVNRYEYEVLVKNFIKLLSWLEATGEFNEEFIRLNKWLGFIKTLPEKETGILFEEAIAFAGYFNDLGYSLLGGYTKKIPEFIVDAKDTYKNREDFIFVTRKENEYFMNMFGAEVMNRQLRNEFLQTEKKAILLPTCMRAKSDTECKAKWDGKEKVCMQCDINCNIGKVANEVSNENTKVYLIPHSSGFSKFLSKWSGQNETGLVGVACALNLLTGGYEMKRLNIPSQCVFLDYCGCKKHWDDSGIATSLNLGQLKNIVIKEKLSVIKEAWLG